MLKKLLPNEQQNILLFFSFVCIKIASANKILNEIAVCARDAHSHSHISNGCAQEWWRRESGKQELYALHAHHCFRCSIHMMLFRCSSNACHHLHHHHLHHHCHFCCLVHHHRHHRLRCHHPLLVCACVHSHVIYDAIELDCSFAKTV